MVGQVTQTSVHRPVIRMFLRPVASTASPAKEGLYRSKPRRVATAMASVRLKTFSLRKTD